MASQLQIWNIALSRTGQSARIENINERSVAAELCDLHYQACLEAVLADGDWPFAEARVYLADIGSPPTNWAYRYRYPVDCLKAKRLAVPGMEVVPADQRIPFKVINAEGGRAIITNQQTAELIYTVRIEDTTYFPPRFVSALAWRLCAELALGLQARPEAYRAALNNYELEISQAQATAYEESEEGPAPMCEFIGARS